MRYRVGLYPYTVEREIIEINLDQYTVPVHCWAWNFWN